MAATTLIQTAHKIFSLKGVFPAITTPFNDKQEVYYNKLHDNLQYYEKLPFSGYLISGSNGEVAAMTIDERLQVLRNVRQSIDPRRMIIANAYCESTRQCCELAKTLARHGADAILVMIPFYHRRSLSEEAVLAHFRVVADSSPVPVIIYNNPGVTGMDISVDTIIKLAEHPNIKGVKDGDVAKIASIIKEVRIRGFDFEVSQGAVGYFLQSLVVGASGAIAALPNILGREVCHLYQLYKDGKIDDASNLQLKLTRIDELLKLSNLGVAGMKGALDVVGLYGGPCRLPLQPLPPQQLKRIRDALVEEDLL
ncbi:4-hydroxy-2-oxoglutarate aldolase, mitochondrial-like [Macrosteles quadrilineatus]|uniref:4-hydroxy-2-oxoglutarate aldolase, mitochondrial-like n=1 Tax=Macrosteles quadrilineatus TaxID=74068 RepID=UPI0023E1E9B3|nr:4-hydroxy-2-oxoglutarate aldolase, mitochondrial-like [Macrosteles quadrilineatus]